MTSTRGSCSSNRSDAGFCVGWDDTRRTRGLPLCIEGSGPSPATHVDVIITRRRVHRVECDKSILAWVEHPFLHGLQPFAQFSEVTMRVNTVGVEDDRGARAGNVGRQDQVSAGLQDTPHLPHGFAVGVKIERISIAAKSK